MGERNAVQHAYDLWARDLGSEKNAGSWYLTSHEVISVSNLQKSQYGPSYYFNQAFWLRQLGEDRYPKVNKCHIQFRLESLLGETSSRLGELMNMDSSLSEGTRQAELTSILNTHLLPVIELGRSVLGLRELYLAGVFKAAGIKGPAEELLNAGS